MKRYIERITGIIPYTHKSVDIPLEGKNLIITGGNGSGKTSFLRTVYDRMVLRIVDRKEADLRELENSLSSYEQALATAQKGTTYYDAWVYNVKSIRSEIKKVETELQVIIPDNIDLSAKYDDRKAVIKYFEDKRLMDIVEAKTAQGLQTEIEENRWTTHDQNVGNKLEQHLVNLKTRRSLAITEDQDQQRADTIDLWFTAFEKNLKHLFEDETAHLRFDTNKNKFSIQQKNKPPFTFQNLSAGYKAIFDIYAELLMRTEYFEISPLELEGAAFIDEIDSHLHVSLQRLILPFFTESFPNIQFIVTTHSPFVLMSTRDTVVFDLGKEAPYSISQVKSQNEILRDYLGVPTAMPVWAEQSLTAILDKYCTRNPEDLSLADLKEELKNAGLETYFPDSAAKILEANQ